MTAPTTGGGFVRSVDGLWGHLDKNGTEPLIFEAEVREKSVEDGTCNVVMVEADSQLTPSEQGTSSLPKFIDLHITGFPGELEHATLRHTIRIQGRLRRGQGGIIVTEPQVVSADVGPGRYSTWRSTQLDNPEAINGLAKELNVEGLEQHLGAELAQGKRILLISSNHSEAYEDIVRGDAARKAYIQLEHTPMQGKNALKGIPTILAEKADPAEHALVVIARGGGGTGALAVFDHRAIQDAIYDCGVPTVTALGHYRDFPMAHACSNWSVATPSDISHLIDAALGWDLFGTRRARTEHIWDLAARCEGAYQRIHAEYRGQAAWKLTVWLSLTFLLIMLFSWPTVAKAWVFVLGVAIAIYRYCATRLRTRKMFEPGKYILPGDSHTKEHSVTVSQVRAGYRDARTPEDYQDAYHNHQILLTETDDHRQLTLQRARARHVLNDDPTPVTDQHLAADNHIDLDDLDPDTLDQPSKDAREHLTQAAAAYQQRVISVAESDTPQTPAPEPVPVNPAAGPVKPPVGIAPAKKPTGSSPRIRGTIKK